METIQQQQLNIFEDYDHLGPFLRQRAKGVPLTTNEEDQNLQVSFPYISLFLYATQCITSFRYLYIQVLTMVSASTLPPTTNTSTVNDLMPDLPTFNYGTTASNFGLVTTSIIQNR
jgi:hypothetical protein